MKTIIEDYIENIVTNHMNIIRKNQCADLLLFCVDILINNAGITKDTLLMRMTEEQLNKAYFECYTEMKQQHSNAEFGLGNGKNIAIAKLNGYLPKDMGRQYAHDGALSAGDRKSVV